MSQLYVNNRLLSLDDTFEIKDDEKFVKAEFYIKHKIRTRKSELSITAIQLII